MSNVNNNQNNESSTGLWWKIPLGVAAVAGAAFGLYKILNEETVEEVVEEVIDNTSDFFK